MRLKVGCAQISGCAVVMDVISSSSYRYLSLVYDSLRTELCSRHVLQVDETTCQVTKDGRSSNTKSYMFVYRTSEHCHENPVILYQYAMTRSRSNVQRFLKGFSGVLESDAFSGYKRRNRRSRRHSVGHMPAGTTPMR